VATTLDLYMPYDTGAGSNVTEDGWRQFAKWWRGDGVIRNTGSEMAVFGDSSGMQVKVPAGEVWIQGNWGKVSSTKTLPIAAAHATLARRDLVIARNDFVNNRIELDVLTGTPAASPTYQSVTQNSSIWEIQLGKVQVAAAASGITAGNVQAIQQFTDGACRYTVDTGEQLVATATDTRVDFDIEVFPSSAVDRVGLNQFQIKRAGQWQAVLTVAWGANVNGIRNAGIARTGQWLTNRLAWSTTVANAGNLVANNVVAMDRFAVGDIIEAWVWQDSGSSLALKSTWSSTSIALYWLGP